MREGALSVLECAGDPASDQILLPPRIAHPRRQTTGASLPATALRPGRDRTSTFPRSATCGPAQDELEAQLVRTGTSQPRTPTLSAAPPSNVCRDAGGERGRSGRVVSGRAATPPGQQANHSRDGEDGDDRHDQDVEQQQRIGNQTPDHHLILTPPDSCATLRSRNPAALSLVSASLCPRLWGAHVSRRALRLAVVAGQGALLASNSGLARG